MAEGVRNATPYAENGRLVIARRAGMIACARAHEVPPGETIVRSASGDEGPRVRHRERSMARSQRARGKLALRPFDQPGRAPELAAGVERYR